MTSAAEGEGFRNADGGNQWGISQSVFPIPHKINSPFSSNFVWHFCEKFAMSVELKFNCGKAFERQCPRETLPIWVSGI